MIECQAFLPQIDDAEPIALRRSASPGHSSKLSLQQMLARPSRPTYVGVTAMLPRWPFKSPKNCFDVSRVCFSGMSQNRRRVASSHICSVQPVQLAHVASHLTNPLHPTAHRPPPFTPPPSPSWDLGKGHRASTQCDTLVAHCGMAMLICGKIGARLLKFCFPFATRRRSAPLRPHSGWNEP